MGSVCCAGCMRPWNHLVWSFQGSCWQDSKFNKPNFWVDFASLTNHVTNVQTIFGSKQLSCSKPCAGEFLDIWGSWGSHELTAVSGSSYRAFLPCLYTIQYFLLLLFSSCKPIISFRIQILPYIFTSSYLSYFCNDPVSK